jgi:ankyrin repeat protein
LFLNVAADFVLYFVLKFASDFFCSSCQRSALHWAALHGRFKVCELLIAGKADLNATDRLVFMFEICY